MDDATTAGLNPRQRQAVLSDASHLLVIAGAGSGKTRVLVHRIAHLIASGRQTPHSILAVTFTNKAAGELKERIAAMVGQDLRYAWVGTFHGLSHRMLRAHHHAAGLRSDFQIIDGADQLLLIRRCTQDLRLDTDQWKPRTLRAQISRAKEQGLRAADWAEAPDAQSQSIYESYERACERSALVDFSELLLRSLELLQKDAAVLGQYRQRFGHLLVDEFQDTNKIQYQWLRLLAGGGGHITAVGDDDQAIYGWRGARVENIREFQGHYPGARLIKLEQNYRSTRTILALANAVISPAEGRLATDKKLWSDGQQGEPVQLLAARNEYHEAEAIAEQAEAWRADGRRLADMAVLYRTHAQSRVLEQQMVQQQLPYRVVGGLRFYERAEIKDALAYARLLANRDDDAAMERIINVPSRKLGAATLDALRANAADKSLWASAAGLLQTGALKAAQANALQGFVNLVDGLDGQRPLPLDELMGAIMERTGLYEWHTRAGGELGQGRADNLTELAAACAAFARDFGDGAAEDGAAGMDALTAFLSQSALDMGDTGGNHDALQLMTLHAAKGLEFDQVALCGLQEGTLPHQMSKTPEQRAEERRLCYVGITRARKRLLLSFAQRRYRDDCPLRMSRFLQNIMDDCRGLLAWMGDIQLPSPPGDGRSRERRAERGARPAAIPGGASGGADALATGQEVSHPRFGTGTITRMAGQGNNAQVWVRFDMGEKCLLRNQAPLQPLA